MNRGIEVVGEVLLLKLGGCQVFSGIDSDKIKNSFVVDEAPLGSFDLVDGGEHSSHGVAVEAVVELVEKEIIEHPKEVEERRNESSSTRESDAGLHQCH